jgi:hypothetical protein
MDAARRPYEVRAEMEVSAPKLPATDERDRYECELIEWYAATPTDGRLCSMEDLRVRESLTRHIAVGWPVERGHGEAFITLLLHTSCDSRNSFDPAAAVAKEDAPRDAACRILQVGGESAVTVPKAAIIRRVRLAEGAHEK